VALTDATNVLKRLELKGELGLAPEDEEAIALLTPIRSRQHDQRS
jgi:hypothetical protein